MISFLLALSLSAVVLPIASSRPASPLLGSTIGSRSNKNGFIANNNKVNPSIITAFGNPRYYTSDVIPSDKPGVNLKVPNFDVVFNKICKVSPLAKQAFYDDRPGGIASITDDADVHAWKVTENNPSKLVSHVSKIDNFDDLGIPIVRLRSSLEGPVTKPGFGESFSELISVDRLRQRHDASNAIIDTIYSAASLDEVKELQGSKYGEPRLFGVGYTKTKQSVVSPREQLTLCGVQDFESGASIVWGVELPEDDDRLFPVDQPKRSPRSTSHLFATTIVPTGETTFDVEYVLQVEIGGFPGWCHAPIVIDTVKKMFQYADGYCKGGLEDGGKGELGARLKELGMMDKYLPAEADVLGDDDAVLDSKEDEAVAESSFAPEEKAEEPVEEVYVSKYFAPTPARSEDNGSKQTAPTPVATASTDDDDAETTPPTPVVAAASTADDDAKTTTPSHKGRKRRALKRAAKKLIGFLPGGR